MRHACGRGAGDTVWVTVWTGATSPPGRPSAWVKRGNRVCDACQMPFISRFFASTS